MLLWAPPFAFVDSQFLLVALCVVFLCAAVAVQVELLRSRLPTPNAFILAAVAIYFGFNLYSKAVALSAHFEVLFLFFASLPQLELARRARWPWLLAWTVLGARVSTDERSIVLLPNRLLLYPIRYFGDADWVLIPSRFDPHASGVQSREEMLAVLRTDSRFEELTSVGGTAVFKRR